MKHLTLFLLIASMLNCAVLTGAPTISRIFPVSIPARMPNPEITITGTGFDPSGSISLNDFTFTLASLGASVNSAGTEIIIPAPVGSTEQFIFQPGALSVTVTVGTETSLPNLPFSYLTAVGDWQALLPYAPDQNGTTFHPSPLFLYNANDFSQPPEEVTLDNFQLKQLSNVVIDPTGNLAYMFGLEPPVVASAPPYLGVYDLRTGTLTTHNLGSAPYSLAVSGGGVLALSPSGDSILIGTRQPGGLSPGQIIQLSTSTFGLQHSYNFNAENRFYANSIAFLPNSDRYAYVAGAAPSYEQITSYQPKIYQLDLSNGGLNFYDEERPVYNDACIAPYPVNADYAGTYQEMVLSQFHISQSVFALFYSNLPSTTNLPIQLSGFSSGFSSQATQILTAPNSEQTFVTNLTIAPHPVSIAIITGQPDSPEITNTIELPISEVRPLLGMALTPDGSKGIATINHNVNPASGQFVLFNPSQPTAPVEIVGPLTTSHGIFNFPAITPDQAPVAYANHSVSGLTVTFDASQSLSPTGFSPTHNGIATYEWDFGDSTTTTTTTDPLISHTYVSSGTHTVTLKVTNIYGTSSGALKFFGTMNYTNPSVKAGPDIFYPSVYTFQVTVSGCNPNLFPPTRAILQKFCNKVCFTYKVKFHPPFIGPAPANYLIYADANRTKLLKTIPASSGPPYVAQFQSCNQNPCFYLFSQDEHGNLSCTYTKVCLKCKC